MDQNALLITSIVAVVLGGAGLIGGVLGYVQGNAAVRRATHARQRAVAAEEEALRAKAAAEATLRAAEELAERFRPSGPRSATGPIGTPRFPTPAQRWDGTPQTGPTLMPQTGPTFLPQTGPTPTPRTGPVTLPQTGSTPMQEPTTGAMLLPDTGPTTIPAPLPKPMTTAPEAAQVERVQAEQIAQPPVQPDADRVPGEAEEDFALLSAPPAASASAGAPSEEATEPEPVTGEAASSGPLQTQPGSDSIGRAADDAPTSTEGVGGAGADGASSDDEEAAAEAAAGPDDGAGSFADADADADETDSAGAAGGAAADVDEEADRSAAERGRSDSEQELIGPDAASSGAAGAETEAEAGTGPGLDAQADAGGEADAERGAAAGRGAEGEDDATGGRDATGRVVAGGGDAPTMDWAEVLRTGAIPLPSISRGTYAAPRRRPKPTGQGPARFELRAIGRQRFEAVNTGGEPAQDARIVGVGDDPHLVRPLAARPVTVPPAGTLSFSLLRVEGREVSVQVVWTRDGEDVHQDLPLV